MLADAVDRLRGEGAPSNRKLLVGAAIVLLLGAAAVLIARALVGPAPEPEPAPVAEDSGFVRFRDAAGGISIAYPSDWERTLSPDPEVRLVAGGDGASLLVRMSDLGIDVGAEDVDEAKRLTDRLVRTGAPAEMLRDPARVTLSGLPGYLYLYTFEDANTGEEGAHAHYFLFRGRTLISLIFQTVPATSFGQDAPLFDRIGDTLRVVASG